MSAGHFFVPVAIIGGGLASLRLGPGHGETLTATGQLLFSAAIAKEAVIADALEAREEDVEKEAADELVSSQRHCPVLVAAALNLPPERDLAGADGNQAIVGDGDAMGVAGDTVQHLFGPAKGGLAQTTHLDLRAARKVAEQDAAVAERRQGAKEAQFVAFDCLLQIFQDQTTEDTSEHSDRHLNLSLRESPAQRGGLCFPARTLTGCSNTWRHGFLHVSRTQDIVSLEAETAQRLQALKLG